MCPHFVCDGHFGNPMTHSSWIIVTLCQGVTNPVRLWRLLGYRDGRWPRFCSKSLSIELSLFIELRVTVVQNQAANICDISVILLLWLFYMPPNDEILTFKEDTFEGVHGTASHSPNSPLLLKLHVTFVAIPLKLLNRPISRGKSAKQDGWCVA